MAEDLEGVVSNIRALIISSKFPIPMRNVDRDYETMMGNPIPYRSFNFQTLESFLQSIPSLRLTGSGRDILVEAIQSTASSHISQLIAKQKTAKKSLPPPKRGRGFSSYRGSYPRSYPPRQWPREPLPRKDFNNAPPPRQPNPRGQLPNNKAELKSLVVKLEDDTRQVVAGNSSHLYSKEHKSSYEVPPRFQRNRPSSITAPMNNQMSSVTDATQKEDATMFLDKPGYTDPPLQEIDNNIISALKPGQLIAVGRVKEQVNEIDEYLQQAMQNSNQDNASHLGGEAEILSVPSPDENAIQNNIHLLMTYSSAMQWCVPEYTVFPRKPKGGSTLYVSTVQISRNNNEKQPKKFSSFPIECESAYVAKGYAAKRALEELRKEEKVKLQQTTISTDKNIINNRISEIVAGVYNGMFAKNVEAIYSKNYNEQLPIDWLQTLNDCPKLTVESTFNDMIIIPRDPPPTVDLDLPIITSVPLTLVPPEENFWNVFVTAAFSTSQVWFRLIGENTSEKYEELLNDMEDYYKMKGITELAMTIEEGQYYAAESNDGWLRICVTKVNDDTKTVNACLIDHGDTDIFSFKNLYRLPVQFCILPKQAIQASLDGLESFSEDPECCEIISLSEHLIGKILIAEVNSKDERTGLVKITLYDTSGSEDIDINDKLREMFISEYENAVPVLPEVSRAVEVDVSHISKKGEVFVQIHNDKFKKMEEIIGSLGPEERDRNKPTSYRQVRLNKIYLALYKKDENWYRAKITSTPSVQQNKIALMFVDYGNSETVSIDELVEVDNFHPIISKLPPQAVKVALNNLPLETLTNSQIARLHSLVLGQDKVVFLRLVKMEGDLPIVNLFYREDGGNGPVVTVNDTIDLESCDQRPDKTSTRKGAIQHTNGNNQLSIPSQTLEEGSHETVQVVLVANPSNFVFQLAKFNKERDDLMIQLQQYYETMNLPELHKEEIIRNAVYAGLYMDNSWYRMVVKGPVGDDLNVPVLLCDFGDTGIISISNLRAMEEEFCELPNLAVNGKLSDILPTHTDWAVEDCLRFQQLVVNKQLECYVISVENCDNVINSVLSVKLVDSTSGIDVDIAEILCSEERAIYIKHT